MVRKFKVQKDSLNLHYWRDLISNDIFYDRQINKLPLAASISSNYRSFRYPIIYRDTIDYAILFIDTSTSQAHFLIGAPYFEIIASNIVHASHFQ